MAYIRRGATWAFRTHHTASHHTTTPASSVPGSLPIGSGSPSPLAAPPNRPPADTDRSSCWIDRTIKNHQKRYLLEPMWFGDGRMGCGLTWVQTVLVREAMRFQLAALAHQAFGCPKKVPCKLRLHVHVHRNLLGVQMLQMLTFIFTRYTPIYCSDVELTSS